MKFYDTNALLNLLDKAFSEEFVISQKTLEEIEHIKTSANKDGDVKYRARRLAHLLDEKHEDYTVVHANQMIYELLTNRYLGGSPDEIIIASAYWYNKIVAPIVFVSDDINCKFIARKIFELQVEGINESVSSYYNGFSEVIMDEEEMARFYENMDANHYNLMINQYLIIKDGTGNIVDVRKWTGETHAAVFKKNIKSMYFDKLKAKDVYQTCAIDTLMTNTLTAISGAAGSGKSLLSLMVAMHLIENGKYDRIVVMFNPTKARGASDMGFYGGDFIDKAMQNSIGQILTTKFGDRYAVDLLLQQNKIKLVSMADARGMEISDNEILWITEAQNTSIDLIKLCLSRVSSGAKVIIEGDHHSQVDSFAFAGNNNGLKRVIDVFKGHEEFGYIELQNTWRSKIAELCQLL